ncbi:response regulator [uncultured Thiodictyon sp.]|jgi:signal transduction histidine kinase|uniref:hybrid sensor histidine kinase/response regulator n=1 Tax=uncultured Thiodictyon sp. TaxID=1846217 RepID=UPI0025ECD6B4|nr:response regulator [uncultured Thiodictyon sp.]
MNNDLTISQGQCAVRVLLVDDNPSKLMALEAALADLGLEIVSVPSGTEALRRLLVQDFAVVLLDVNMPIMDGFETAALIRTRPRSEHLPIIFITAERLADEARLQAYALGAVDYILSPVLPDILRAKVSVFADLFRLRNRILQDAGEIAEKNQVIARQNRQLTDANERLQELNATLEQRVAEQLARLREQDHLLIRQSRLAVMGEMIGNIAHQWRQPLNALALVLGNIEDAARHGDLSPEYLGQKIADAHRLIDKMSSTISDFRDFFRPDKSPAPFAVSRPIGAAIALVAASLKAHGIEVVTEIIEDVRTLGTANEYSQVILNLLGNAKDAIIARNLGRGQITVQVDRAGDQARVRISDTGGGIADEVLARIFEPYFSTKPGGTGTGTGLYMSKMIIENGMGGRIRARTLEAGAEFTLLTPLAPEGPP